MTLVYGILVSSVPLMLAATGALISEYAGVLAVCADGIINLGAFLTFLMGFYTGNALAGALIAVVICALVMLLAALFTEKTKANPFVTGIAVNLLSSGFTSVCSSAEFGTKGVLSPALLKATCSFPDGIFTLKTAGYVNAAVIPCLLAILLVYPCVKHTRWGLRLLVTGESPELPLKKGFNPGFYRCSSWCLAGVFAAAAGVLLTLRLSSFVPNISSGRGWIALAAVYLGRKNLFGTVLSAILFTAAGYAADSIQTAAGISFIPSSILPALPYLVVTLLFFAGRAKKS